MYKNKFLHKINLILLGFVFTLICFCLKSYAADNENGELSISMSRVIEDGVYYITSSQDSNLVVEVKDGNLDNGGTLQLAKKNEDTCKKFYIHYDGNGYYKIENVSSTKVIEIAGGVTDSETPLQQYDDNGTSSQRWKVRKNIDGTYNFIAECSGKAMDIADGIIAQASGIWQYDYNNSYAQRFKLEKTEIFDDNFNGGIMLIRAKGDSSKQIDLKNASTEEGTEIQLWTVAESFAQRFQIQRVGENEVRIRTAASGGYLKESSNNAGASIVQSGNSSTKPSDSDTWKVVYDKGIVFINKESGLALTINGDYVDGAKIEVNTKTDDVKQRFVVRPVNLIPTDYYNITSAYGTVLEVENSGTAIGTNIIAGANNDQNGQVFEVKYKDGGYQIKSPLSGYVVEVAEQSNDSGANVQLGDDTDSIWQRWIPEIEDGGYVAFKNLKSGLMLNIQDGNSSPGANVNQETENNSDSQKWRLTQTELYSDEYVRVNNEYYYYDTSGNPTLIARNLGGWDFTDWDYVMRMRSQAEADGSPTDWYAIIDCDKPCRDLFFHRENGQWVAVAGYYAVQGFITLEGGSRTIPGLHQVDHKYETSIAGPGYITSFFPHWIDDVVSPETDDAQVFHGSYERGSSGYATHGCSALTLEYSKWVYENIPLNTNVRVMGNATGIPAGDDPDMPADVQVQPIQDPFA